MLNVMKAVTTAKTLFVNAKVGVQILEKLSRKKIWPTESRLKTLKITWTIKSVRPRNLWSWEIAILAVTMN